MKEKEGCTNLMDHFSLVLFMMANAKMAIIYSQMDLHL